MTTPLPKNRDWSSLSKLILFKIAGHLNAIDNVRYRSVCTSWRASSPPRPKIPLIVICTRNYFRHLTALYFRDLVRNQNIALSSVTAIDAFRSLLDANYDYIGCSHEWVIMAAIQKKPMISLLNPFTGEKVILPEMNEVNVSPIKSLRVVLSLPVVVCYSLYPSEISFIRFGETEWKRIQLPSPLRGVAAFKGLFYGHYYGRSRDKLYLIDLEANNGNSSVFPVQLDLPDMLSGEVLTWEFLVEFSGDLLVAFSSPNRGNKYEFLKVDFDNGSLQMLPEIGKHVLFLGQSLPVFVPPERLLDFSPDITKNSGVLLSVYDSYQFGSILSLDGKFKNRDRYRVPVGWISPVLNKSLE